MVRRNLSFAPNDMYIRPDSMLGIWMVRLAPLRGPEIETSGVGTGGTAPRGHGVNAPPALTKPSRPVVRFTPTTYRKTASPRPELLVTVSGSSGRCAAVAVVARTRAGTAAATAASQESTFRRVTITSCSERSQRRGTAFRAN